MSQLAPKPQPSPSPSTTKAARPTVKPRTPPPIRPSTAAGVAEKAPGGVGPEPPTTLRMRGSGGDTGVGSRGAVDQVARDLVMHFVRSLIGSPANATRPAGGIGTDAARTALRSLARADEVASTNERLTDARPGRLVAAGREVVPIAPPSGPDIPFVLESDFGGSFLRTIGYQLKPWTVGAISQTWTPGRFLLGLPMDGIRIDNTVMVSLGPDAWKVSVGRVTAHSNGATADLEVQTADIIQGSVTFPAGLNLTLSVWNDTRHGTDQSVYTGGIKFDVAKPRWNVTLGERRLDRVSLTFRVGTGIPDGSAVEKVDGHDQYVARAIAYPDASKAHLMLTGRFHDSKGQHLELSAVLSSGDLQNAVQSRLLHTGFGLAPEFPNTGETGFHLEAKFEF
jgi:hypothetical protein